MPTGESDADPVDRRRESVFSPVERAFTCVACGYAATTTVPQLQAERHAVCPNCSDWTTQLANERSVIDATRDVAKALAGPTLTDRQALAYLLRDVVGLERKPTADVMDSTPSNVDNLQRKAREKLDDAQRVLDAIDAVEPEEPTA